MSLAQWVYGKISGSQSVLALVPLAKITVDTRADETTFPAIVYGISNEESLQSTTVAVASIADVEVVCFATTRMAALAIRGAVYAALERQTGSAGGKTVLHCLYKASASIYNDPDSGQSTGTFIESIVFQVAYTGGP